MKFELSLLQKFIADIAPESIRILGANEFAEKQKEWLGFISAEKERVCAAITNSVYQVQDSILLEVFIQHHIQVLTTLADTLLEYKKKLPPKHTARYFYKLVCSYIDDILGYIMNYFGKYFDDKLTLPKTHAAIAATSIAEKILEIEALFKQTAVRAPLLQIALKPLHAFAADPYHATYKYLNYLQQLCQQLLLIEQESWENHVFYNFALIVDHLKDTGRSEASINVKLFILLIYMNFNVTEFAGYCIENLKQKLKGLSKHDGRKLLETYIKLFEHFRIKPHAALDDSQPENILDMLRRFMVLEISYIATYDTSSDNAASSPAPTRNDHFKIKTDASIREIAVILRLFADAKIGIIRNKLNQDFFDRAAEYISTKNADTVSPKSVKSKSHALELGAMRRVKDRLLNCINLLQSWITKYPSTDF
ncbi:hypothetical protein J2T02_002591 [Chitinophaga terrae (ex Kim and Jung 2007)]|uniref:hypothetical protein n=1 Tax=Chitinophaga terrae (ex Kim and Jung 2007) TaxID=408074 RepID=UPI00278ABABA|nr:hypothetical protein [Chitinophaga terrae (ex Kim and Jung 2007)]MDQ0107472.1 hypothetical protein [Chitinophaga terrae (ex Kim and Jung 2007)]